MNKDFHQRFDRSQRRFDLMFRAIATMIGMVFVGIIVFWIAVAVLAFNAADTVQDQGVRGLVQQLWCGKNATDCRLPF